MSSKKNIFEEITDISSDDKKDEISHHSEELQNGSKSDDESSSSSSSSSTSVKSCHDDPKNDSKNDSKNYDNHVNDETFAHFEPIIPEIVVTPAEDNFVPPDNFVMRYLKQNYEEYYDMLVKDLKKAKKSNNSANSPNSANSANYANVSSSSTVNSTSKKIEYDFPPVKTKAEEDAENLANMCVVHAKYDEMIKNPIEAKIKNGYHIPDSGDSKPVTNNTNETIDFLKISLDPNNLNPNEYKIVMDKYTFIQNRLTGRAVLITKEGDTNMYNYLSHKFDNAVLKTVNNIGLQNSVIKQVPFNIRRRIATYKLAEKMRSPDIPFEIRKLAWRMANDNSISLIERYLSNNNWVFPGSTVMSQEFCISLNISVHLRKCWSHIWKNYDLMSA